MNKQKNENPSKLVRDMRVVRALLKKNLSKQPLYCRYCGKLLSEGCECYHFNEVIDVKPYKKNGKMVTVDTENGPLFKTVVIFSDTPSFRADFDEVSEMIRIKDEERAAEEKAE